MYMYDVAIADRFELIGKVKSNHNDLGGSSNFDAFVGFDVYLLHCFCDSLLPERLQGKQPSDVGVEPCLGSILPLMHLTGPAAVTDDSLLMVISIANHDFYLVWTLLC